MRTFALICVGLALCAVAVRDFGTRIADAISYVFPRLSEWRMSPAIFGLDTRKFATPGTPIDSALYHRNRHEAGFARLAALRHT